MSLYDVTIGEAWTARVEAATSDAARRAGARAFRRTVSDKIPVTFLCSPLSKVRRVRPVPNFSIVSEDDKSYFVGFWEGDGSASYSKQNRGPVIVLTQKEPQILEHIKTTFRLDEAVKPASSGGYALWVTRHAIVALLFDILKERVVLPGRVEQLRAVFKSDVIGHRPTWPWLAGIVDADGWVGLTSRTPILAVSQTDTRGPPSIRALVGFGSIDTGHSPRIRWHGASALEVIDKIYPYMQNLGKKQQIYALLTLLGKLEGG